MSNGEGSTRIIAFQKTSPSTTLQFWIWAGVDVNCIRGVRSQDPCGFIDEIGSLGKGSDAGNLGSLVGFKDVYVKAKLRQGLAQP
jgi:hypothetical protein